MPETQWGQRLVQRAVITAAQLNEVLEEEKKTDTFLGILLVRKGLASEEQVARALSEQLGLAYIDLATRPIDPETLDFIPESLCRTHRAVPVLALGDSVTVAMANPLDAKAIEELKEASQRNIRPAVATPTSIVRALEGALQRRMNLPDGAASGRAPAAGGNKTTAAAGPSTGSGRTDPASSAPVSPSMDPIANLKAVASLAPVVQLVDGLIAEAVTAGASDIHLEPGKEQFRCRFRVDGILLDRPPIPKEYQAAVISRLKIMANMDIAEKRLPQDGRIEKAAAGRTIDLRVSSFPTINGENVVMRILDKQRSLMRLEDLGFLEGTLGVFNDLISKPHGIILVTGPTGSGKTTTLYGALQRIDRTEKNVMTLEDPVEYELPGVCQSQVNIKAGLTFALGLRSMVRQDPDVILIGEIRDKETADIAIHASLTGHLVFSTLHTNDASSSATRLVDLGVEPFLVATSLIGILAQRLVRTLCASCKAPYDPPAELVQRLGVTPKPGMKFSKEVGCFRCRQTGYQGRLGIYELLVPNDRIREMITKNVPAGLIREEAVKNGMVSLRQDGIEKVVRGMTSVSEVLRVTGEGE